MVGHQHLQRRLFTIPEVLKLLLDALLGLLGIQSLHQVRLEGHARVRQRSLLHLLHLLEDLRVAPSPRPHHQRPRLP